MVSESLCSHTHVCTFTYMQRSEGGLQIFLLPRRQNNIGTLLRQAACNTQADPVMDGEGPGWGWGCQDSRDEGGRKVSIM
jgi:hypothetical protein